MNVLKKEEIKTQIIGKNSKNADEALALADGDETFIDSGLAEQITIDEVNLSPIQKIDVMTGRQFEEFLAEFFKKRGYETTLTPSSGDYGVDLIIENDFMKIGIQAKCYSEKVSNSAVQEAVTAIRHYNLDKVMVITNNYFQPSAIRLAQDNNVILWNRDKLIEELGK